MKKAFSVLCAVLCIAACTKDLEPSKDILLEGDELNLKGFGGNYRKLFVLNEGGMGANNATLDVLRLQRGMYVRSAFRKMNPAVSGGLGDVGNDIALHGEELWMVI
ncbi:MAG: YncE family protein, partial [Bacteroidales bacterium]|nr:YncE family protein [Bacteroidales bacterium]